MILNDVWEISMSRGIRDFHLVQWYAQRKGKKPTNFSYYWEDTPEKTIENQSDNKTLKWKVNI